MPVLQDDGANGKSTFVQALWAALGDHAVMPDQVGGNAARLPDRAT
jgi:hypothetical protein